MNTTFRSATDHDASASNQQLRTLLLIGAAFVAWKAWRGLRSLFWMAFGIGWVMFWTHGWHGF